MTQHAHPINFLFTRNHATFRGISPQEACMNNLTFFCNKDLFFDSVIFKCLFG